MEHAPFSALILDEERLVYANRTGLANRLRIGPLSGDRFYEGLPAAYNADVLPVNQRVVRERQPVATTKLLADADGRQRHWHTVRFPLDDEDGKTLLGMYAIDVTEVFEALEAKDVAQRQTQVAYKMAALGEMAGGIAHEINNPVAIISGKGRQLLEILASEPLDLDEARRFVQVMVDTAKRIAGIVNGLRTISRPAERDPCSPTQVTGLVESTAAMLMPRFRHAGVTLEVAPGEGDLVLECRAAEVSQVLTNLLSNALDAVEAQPEPWVRLTVEPRADGVAFVVEDNGPGVPPEIRTKIMQPFFTTKEIGRGTGLGLSISRSLAEGHGGRLTLDETAGRTRFVAEFPFEQAREAPAKSA
jgi:C4-dicarboxylate-specific signal transduction histidine kinase